MEHPISLYYIMVCVGLVGIYQATYLVTSTSLEEARQKIADYENTDIANCGGRWICRTDAPLFTTLQ